MTDEEIRFVKDHVAGTSARTMTELVRERFGTSYSLRQMQHVYAKNGLHSGLTGHFRKGGTPHNKGVKGFYAPGVEKGWYKAGQLPHNTEPVGTELKRSDGYWWRKIDDKPKGYQKNWKQVHRILWEEANGPIPDGMMVRFKDGNVDNLRLDNLMLCTMGENGTMNKNVTGEGGAEYAETRLLMAKIMIAAGRKK